MPAAHRTVSAADYEPAPFGVVDGRRQPCDAVVHVACTFCGAGWLVAATKVAEPCLCGAQVVAT